MGVSLTNLLAAVRDHCQDNDTTTANYVFADAVYTRAINRYYALWRYGTDKRVVRASSTALGTTFTSGTESLLTSIATYQVRRFLNAYIVSSNSSLVPTSKPLERVRKPEIQEWRIDYPTGGTPVRYYVGRTYQPTTPGKWEMWVHPVPTSTIEIMADVEAEEAALASGSDILDGSDSECYGIAALAGAWGALRAGREELVDRILSEVPPTMQALADNIRSQTKPHRKAGEEAV